MQKVTTTDPRVRNPMALPSLKSMDRRLQLRPDKLNYRMYDNASTLESLNFCIVVFKMRIDDAVDTTRMNRNTCRTNSTNVLLHFYPQWKSERFRSLSVNISTTPVRLSRMLRSSLISGKTRDSRNPFLGVCSPTFEWGGKPLLHWKKCY